MTTYYAWTNSDYNATIYTDTLTPTVASSFYDSEGNDITSYLNCADCGINNITPTTIVWGVGGKDYTIPPTSTVVRMGTYNYNRDLINDITEINYISNLSNGTDTYAIKDAEARTAIAGKQDTLVSGTNIKTINNTSILGSGNISISTGDYDNETITKNGSDELQTVAIVNPNTNNSAISPLKIWNGTEQQWTNGEATTWNYWQTDVQAMGTESTLPSSAYWYSVTYGDGKFVAVVYMSNKAAYSTDGINWTSSTLPSSAKWYSVTYGDGKFVAVASNSNKAAYSTNGINWTASTLPSSADWYSVTYGDGKFVVVAYNSDKSAYSTDGINWTSSTLPSSANWRSVTYGDGKFVVVTYTSNQSAYSTDGINWTSSTLPSSTSWQSVTYGDGKFVVVAFNSDKSACSFDGINWTASTLPSSTSWREVTYGDGKFVVVANGNDKAAAFTIQYDKCYTLDSIPTTSSQVYSAPETTSTKTITSVGSGTITLSDNLVYNSTPSGNQNTYRTLGVAHPNWICNINNVGVKIGNTIIATDGSDLLPSQSGNNGKFLTTNGTTASWGNVTIPFGESTSAADAVQKEVTISEITELKTGQIIIVKPRITSTVADATLKLNNFTAYPMLYGAAAITTSTDSITWAANYPSWFRFDGSNWVFLGHGVDNNTTYSAMSVSEGTTGTKTTARSVRADYLKQIIQGTTLTGLSTSTNSAVVATDTVTTGIGKLQAQVNNKVDKTSIATTSTAGLVKPDGTSITIDSNGTISASAGAYAMVIVDYTAEEE